MRLLSFLLHIKMVFDNFFVKTFILNAKNNEIDTNPFNYVSGNKISKDEEITGTAASWYKLMKTLGVIGLVIAIIVCGCILVLTKDSRKRNEAKNNLIFKICIFVLIIAFVWFIGSIAKIVFSLV